jgi:6-phosphofructokinase 2
MPAVLTVTLNPAVDCSTSVENVSPDQKLRCDPPRYDPGGGGVNVARVVSRLGGEAAALYTAGGPAGQMLGELLADEGVARQVVQVAGRTRENLAVREGSTDHQYRFTMPGPELAEEEWREVLERVEGQDPRPAYVVASGSLPRGAPADFYARLAAAARRAGSRLVLDSSGEALAAALKEGVHLVKPNLRELASLAGEDIQDEDHLARAARGLVDRGSAEVVLVSRGAGGAYLAHAEGGRHLRAPTVPQKSKVGAGDSMVGALVHALARGRSLEEAASLGVAAGAAAVMTPGSGLCRAEDVERLAGGGD